MTGDFFGADVAARYDASVDAMADPELLRRTVDFLIRFVGDHGALEFAIGTGRVAIPLSRRGVRVSGIDSSEAMLEQLLRKPEAAAIDVTSGDMATTRVDGTFDLVYLVFNTIMNLTTQDAQVACFENAARHLARGGAFVVEVGVPDLRSLPPGQRFVPFTVDGRRVGVDEYTDIPNQQMYSHHYRVGAESRMSIPFRYVWPAELDLMARIAGMTLVERWADWDRSPFTGDSRAHVSVWKRA